MLLYFFSFQRKRSKIFSTILAFSFSQSFPVYTNSFSFENAYFLSRVLPSSTETQTPESGLNWQHMTLFSAPFSKASVFTYPYSLETECFQNAPLPKSLPSAFSVVLVKSIGENASKSMRFRTKTHTCGRGIKLLHANSRIIVRRRK